MATTGTAAWNPAITNIIRQALLNVGAINESETPGTSLWTDALFKANAMIKELMATGLHVWAEEEAILFLQPGQVRYPIGGDVTTHTSDAEGWTLDELAANAYTGDSDITVDDADGFTVGDNIGIVLDDDTTFWTVVDAIAGDVITLEDVMTGDAGSGNAVFAYTTPILRPLKIPDCRLLQFQNMNETWMTVMSRKDYMDTPNKLQPGISTQFFYSPQLVSGLLYVWPAPSNSNYAVRFTWYRPLFDFDNPANTCDAPQEWVNAIIWCLSKELAPSYGVDEATWQRIVTMAAEKYDLVSRYDRESEPVQFGIDWTAR